MGRRATQEQVDQYILDIEKLIKHFGTLDKAAEVLGAARDTMRAHYAKRKFPSSAITERVHEFVIALPTERMSPEAQNHFNAALNIQYQAGYKSGQISVAQIGVYDHTLNGEIAELLKKRNEHIQLFKEAINRA